MITGTKNVIADLKKTLANCLKAPRSNSRREFGIAFAAKRDIDILEYEENIDDAIASIEECIRDDHYMIASLGSISVRDEAYYKGRLAVDDDVLGSLKSIKEILNAHWMMTGTAVDKTTHQPINGRNSTVKMWVVSGEDRLRIEEAGKKIIGDNYNYINIDFLPW